MTGVQTCALPIYRVSLASGEVECLASGFRTPNGIGLAADGSLYVTANQGDWLPARKLVLLEAGSFLGWPSPADRAQIASAPCCERASIPVVPVSSPHNISSPPPHLNPPTLG